MSLAREQWARSGRAVLEMLNEADERRRDRMQRLLDWCDEGARNRWELPRDLAVDINAWLIRESGDSIPAEAFVDRYIRRRSEGADVAEPPVLNKSGGSGRLKPYETDHWRQHRGIGRCDLSLACDDCGAAMGEACRPYLNKSGGSDVEGK